MELPEVKNGFKGPTRVIVDKDGLGVSSKIAKDVCQVTSDIIFIRDDGWSLGAPKEFEKVAFDIWKDSWTHFVRKGHTQWISIEKYIHV